MLSDKLFTLMAAVTIHFPSVTKVGDRVHAPDEGITYELVKGNDPIIGECFKFRRIKDEAR